MTPEHLEWVRKHFAELVLASGFDQFLGMKAVEITEGKVVLSMKIAEKHGNIYGSVHGGILASVADIVMGIPCMTLGKRIVTIDMSVSFIKNAPTGSTITAVGRIISKGNRVIRSVGEIYNGEELLVRAQASYFVTGDFTEDDYPEPALSKK